MVNRLKPLFQNIISPNQSVFLQGRSIQDNSILAHEIFHSMKKKRGSGGLMALKLDMEKAFDRMEWSFILKYPKGFLLLRLLSEMDSTN
jgi:hypothetical protein